MTTKIAPALSLKVRQQALKLDDTKNVLEEDETEVGRGNTPEQQPDKVCFALGVTETDTVPSNQAGHHQEYQIHQRLVIVPDIKHSSK